MLSEFGKEKNNFRRLGLLKLCECYLLQECGILRWIVSNIIFSCCEMFLAGDFFCHKKRNSQKNVCFLKTFQQSHFDAFVLLKHQMFFLTSWISFKPGKQKPDTCLFLFKSFFVNIFFVFFQFEELLDLKKTYTDKKKRVPKGLNSGIETCDEDIEAYEKSKPFFFLILIPSFFFFFLRKVAVWSILSLWNSYLHVRNKYFFYFSPLLFFENQFFFWKK